MDELRWRALYDRTFGSFRFVGWIYARKSTMDLLLDNKAVLGAPLNAASDLDMNVYDWREVRLDPSGAFSTWSYTTRNVLVALNTSASFSNMTYFDYPG